LLNALILLAVERVLAPSPLAGRAGVEFTPRHPPLTNHQTVSPVREVFTVQPGRETAEEIATNLIILVLL
jgi:hypothetical protein